MVGALGLSADSCLGFTGMSICGMVVGLGPDACNGVYTDINIISVYMVMDCTRCGGVNSLIDQLDDMTVNNDPPESFEIRRGSPPESFTIRRDTNQLDYDMYWCPSVKPVLELHVKQGCMERYWRHGGRVYEFDDLVFDGELGELQKELVLYSKGYKIATNMPLYYGNYRIDGPQLGI